MTQETSVYYIWSIWRFPNETYGFGGSPIKQTISIQPKLYIYIIYTYIHYIYIHTTLYICMYINTYIHHIYIIYIYVHHQIFPSNPPELIQPSNAYAEGFAVPSWQWRSRLQCSPCPTPGDGPGDGHLMGFMGFHEVYPLVNQHNYGKSPFLMGKSTISMTIFNSYVSLPEGN